MKRAGIRGRTVLIIVAVFILMIVLYLALTVIFKEKPPAVDFTGVSASSSHVTLADNYGKSGTLLVFYDTETEKAVETMKLIQKHAPDYPTVDILSVSVDQGTLEERVAKAKKAGITLDDHSLFDVDGEIAKLYGVTTQLPCLYFIDKDGIVQDAYPVNITESTLESELENIA